MNEKLIRQQCINDFKEIINNINIIPDLDGVYEDIIFCSAIWKYKKELIKRLEKFSEIVRQDEIEKTIQLIENIKNSKVNLKKFNYKEFCDLIILELKMSLIESERIND